MGKELSGKWEMVKLGDVCEKMHQGINTVADKVEYIESGTPIIQSRNMTSGKLNLQDVKFIDLETYNRYMKKYKPLIGNVLLANIGTIGKTLVVNEDIDFLIAWNVFLISLKLNEINPIYLKNYMDFLLLNRYYDNKLTGGTVKFINKKTLSEIKIPLPPLEIQKEIARNLDLASELVKLHKRKLEELDKLIQSVFYDMFGDPVTNEMGWKVEKLGNLVNLKAGKNIKANQLHEKNEIDKFPCYGGNGIRGYINEYSHEGEYSLIGRQGALCGNVQFVEQKFYATEHAVVVTPIIEIESKWMYYILKFLDLNRLQTGAAQPGLNIEILSNVDILCVPLEFQRKFTDIILEVENQKLQMQMILSDAEMLYNSLMQECFE